MKNKITFSTLAFAAFFSFINPAYCQTMTNSVCSSEYPVEVLAPDFDCCVHDAYRYISVGVGPEILSPGIGIGYRQRYARFGWDTSLSCSVNEYFQELNAHLVGHYYLSPAQDSAYVGLGVMGGGLWNKRVKGVGKLSPDFVFGKELGATGNSRHFIEMHMTVPTAIMKRAHVYTVSNPRVYLKYGMSF